MRKNLIGLHNGSIFTNQLKQIMEKPHNTKWQILPLGKYDNIIKNCENRRTEARHIVEAVHKLLFLASIDVRCLTKMPYLSVYFFKWGESKHKQYSSNIDNIMLIDF